jgi:hypothetical protein
LGCSFFFGFLAFTFPGAAKSQFWRAPFAFTFPGAVKRQFWRTPFDEDTTQVLVAQVLLLCRAWTSQYLYFYTSKARKLVVSRNLHLHYADLPTVLPQGFHQCASTSCCLGVSQKTRRQNRRQVLLGLW